jgi:hypothetical protein
MGRFENEDARYRMLDAGYAIFAARGPSSLRFAEAGS